jgi:methyl-accepting chemotaxis protein
MKIDKLSASEPASLLFATQSAVAEENSLNGSGEVRRVKRGFLGQRRRYLVDRKSQLRASALILGTALILIVVLNLSLHSARTSSTAALVAEHPGLETVLTTEGRIELVLVAIASLVFLLAVLLFTIIETHKTAGAAWNLTQQLCRIESGDFTANLVLRKGDTLRTVESAFNRMSQALRDRTRDEAEELEQLAEIALSTIDSTQASELAEQLRSLANHKRESLE